MSGEFKKMFIFRDMKRFFTIKKNDSVVNSAIRKSVLCYIRQEVLRREAYGIDERMLLDGGIFLGTLAFMADFWTGKLLHEWIGLAVVLFVTHLLINRRWYGKAFTSKGVPMNGVRKTFNCLLLFMTLGMIVSSLFLSEYVFGFLGLGGDKVGLTPHLICSYWGFLIMAMHIGLHWPMLLAQFKKTALGKTLCGQAWLGRVGAIITVVLGAVSLWHQQYGAHLFMRIGTSDLPHQESLILFTVEQLLIMGLFIVGIRAVQKLVLGRCTKATS